MWQSPHTRAPILQLCPPGLPAESDEDGRHAAASLPIIHLQAREQVVAGCVQAGARWHLRPKQQWDCTIKHPQYDLVLRLACESCRCGASEGHVRSLMGLAMARLQGEHQGSRSTTREQIIGEIHLHRSRYI
ncbi:hypothetical protein NDU88_005920 [Pleurodeles waltl]|uniref:Uncharacterized protein n=1 Tax=Pleurodeles waltl TaxID=8319 RepID=A0AAV7TBU4_PLEWA|nr:hypothetical protein NDU88_005920 [Pleurodeles waltl]